MRDQLVVKPEQLFKRNFSSVGCHPMSFWLSGRTEDKRGAGGGSSRSSSSVLCVSAAPREDDTSRQLQ